MDIKPKWQRARIVSQEGAATRRFSLVGREMWLRIEHPQDAQGNLYGLDRYGTTHNGVHCNVVANNKPMVVTLDFFELLARGPEDFADEVPMVTYEQWASEQTEAAAK